MAVGAIQQVPVVDPFLVDFAGVAEPHAAFPIEDQVVGASQRTAVTFDVKRPYAAGLEVHALDRAALVVVRRVAVRRDAAGRRYARMAAAG